MNDLVESGLWSIPNFTTNAPTSGKFLVTVQVSHDEKTIMQLATVEGAAVNSSRMMRRVDVVQSNGTITWGKESSTSEAQINGWFINNPIGRFYRYCIKHKHWMVNKLYW